MSKGRIHPDDIALVRSKAPIEEIISERVTLRRVGANMSGLCPFHDDSSPSFTVSPDRGLWTCFGCGEGGDVISFVQQAEGLPFVEAVTKLAERMNIQLRYLDGDPSYVAPPPGQRARLLLANKKANDFFVSKLVGNPESEIGRKYLEERNFDEKSWETFSVGYAPNGHDSLLKHLQSEGLTVDEIVLAGLAVKNEEGRTYDRFRGRLIWPIKDLSGEIIGFGARRLREDDKGPKWLNTPDTPLYRKSEVLYGIDMARKNIASKKTIVVVEGYGDVMAAHLAGVDTAVATCGTAFGEGHIRIVRRILRDDDSYNGKVIFTFDGDEAGQKAALRAFKDNNKFTAQTYVAVAPENMDPCDLRLHRGDEAVRNLVENAVPLVEFVIKTTLAKYSLNASEGRVSALKAAAPLVAGIRDEALRTEYARRLSGWLTLPDHSVHAAIADAQRQASQTYKQSYEPAPAEETPEEIERKASGAWKPKSDDVTLRDEREAAKCLLQAFEESSEWLAKANSELFSSKAYRGIYTLVSRANSADSETDRLHKIREQAAGDEHVAAFVNELAIEPLKNGTITLTDYVDNVFTRLTDKSLERQITTLKSALNEADSEKQAELLTQILAIESKRRSMRRP